MIYTPIYKQKTESTFQRFAARIGRLLASENIRDGSKLILGCTAFSAAGWYGIPYLAMAI